HSFGLVSANFTSRIRATPSGTGNTYVAPVSGPTSICSRRTPSSNRTVVPGRGLGGVIVEVIVSWYGWVGAGVHTLATTLLAVAELGTHAAAAVTAARATSGTRRYHVVVVMWTPPLAVLAQPYPRAAIPVWWPTRPVSEGHRGRRVRLPGPVPELVVTPVVGRPE